MPLRSASVPRLRTSPIGENRSGSDSSMSSPMTRGLASAILRTRSAKDLAAPRPGAVARETFAVDIDNDDRRCFRWRGQERQRTIEYYFTDIFAQVEPARRPQQQCRGETAAAKNGNRQWPRAKTHGSSLSLSRPDDLRRYWWAIHGNPRRRDTTPAAVRPIQGGSSTKINAANLLRRPQESGRLR
jgi:hypothetical protein